MIDTSKIGGILSAIKAGYGFKNVVTPAVDNLTAISIPDVATLLVTAEAQAILSGDPAPTIELLTEVRANIISAYDKAVEFSLHSNNVSGVNLVGEPNFVTMAKTAQAARDINGPDVPNIVPRVFSSITQSVDISTDVTNLKLSIEAFLDDIPALVLSIQAEAIALEAKLSSQITNDTSAFAEAKLTVAQFSAASNLVSLRDDKDMSPIMDLIMTDELKTEVDKSSLLSKQKVTDSIYE